MLIAVGIETAVAPDQKTGFCISFRVESDDLESVGGNVSQEGNVVFSCHLVVKGDIIFILDSCNMDAVLFFCGFFWFQHRQSDAAAADDSLTGGVDDISTDGADVEA